MAEKSGVQSVERIFQLIEHLAAHPTGVSLQRLAEETGLAKSTVHRLLASLVGLGYVVQDEENGHYRLTLKMFELSSGIVDSMDIMGVAKAHLERLSQRTGEAVHLVIRDGRDIVYIYKTESGPMRMSSRVGLRSPLYCTGVGKAILATLPGDELEDIWTHSNVQKLTDKTITDLEELRSQLVEVRANGYAIDDEENELGVRCVAVAIPGADGRAESAFSISGLAPYMTPERIRRIATLALDARTDILADLGLRRTGDGCLPPLPLSSAAHSRRPAITAPLSLASQGGSLPPPRRPEGWPPYVLPVDCCLPAGRRGRRPLQASLQAFRLFVGEGFIPPAPPRH